MLFLELLTFKDLKILKKFKTGQAFGSSQNSQTSFNNNNSQGSQPISEENPDNFEEVVINLESSKKTSE